MILQFARVAFGLTSSLFLLNTTIKHFENYLPKADYRKVIQKLIFNLHVDDSTNIFIRIEDPIQFYEKSKSVLADTNYCLRNGRQMI